MCKKYYSRLFETSLTNASATTVPLPDARARPNRRGSRALTIQSGTRATSRSLLFRSYVAYDGDGDGDLLSYDDFLVVLTCSFSTFYVSFFFFSFYFITIHFTRSADRIIQRSTSGAHADVCDF